MRTSSFRGWAGIAIFAAACGGGSEAASGGDVGAESSSGGEVAAQALQRVSLVEPGAEPRRQLRYTFPVGATETMLLEMQTTVGSGVGEAVQDVATPPMRLAAQLTVESVDPSGDTRIAFRFTQADVVRDGGVDPAMADAMAQSISMVRGLEGHYVISARGETREAHIRVPDGASPQLLGLANEMQRSMSQSSAPFPAEPIGVGGSWRVDSTVNAGGIVIAQQTTYRLTELTDSGGRASMHVTQSAEPQEMPVPAAPGAVLRVRRMAGTGEGELGFFLNRLVPASTADVRVEMDSEVSADGQVTPIQNRSRVRVAIRSQ